MLVELDMHELFGVDMSDRQLLRSRTWRWMRVRLLGLLSTEGRVQRVLNPTPEQKKMQNGKSSQHERRDAPMQPR